MTTTSKPFALRNCLPAIRERPAVGRPYVPPEFFLLMDAVDANGRRRYPAEWNGRELLARPASAIVKPVGPVHFPGLKKVQPIRTVNTNPPASAASDYWKAEYFVATAMGVRMCATKDEADALWEREKVALLAMLDAEIAAACRYREVALDLRNKFASGTIVAEILAKDGRRYPIVQHAWSAADAGGVFYLGDQAERWEKASYAAMPCRMPSGGVATIQGYIIVRQDDVGGVATQAVEAGALETHEVAREVVVALGHLDDIDRNRRTPFSTMDDATALRWLKSKTPPFTCNCGITAPDAESFHTHVIEAHSIRNERGEIISKAVFAIPGAHEQALSLGFIPPRQIIASTVESGAHEKTLQPAAEQSRPMPPATSAEPPAVSVNTSNRRPARKPWSETAKQQAVGWCATVTKERNLPPSRKEFFTYAMDPNGLNLSRATAEKILAVVPDEHRQAGGHPGTLR